MSAIVRREIANVIQDSKDDFVMKHAILDTMAYSANKNVIVIIMSHVMQKLENALLLS
jgi:hypothetical protein